MHNPSNACAETVATSPLFRHAFSKRRCLVPATGFFEWQTTVDGTVPYRIHRRDSEPFAFAGIWNEGKDDAGEPGNFASITTEPNRLMAPIHDRMPVILHEDDYSRWLEGSDQADAAALLVPSPAGELDAYPVSTLVNTPRNNIPAVIEPQTPTP